MVRVFLHTRLSAFVVCNDLYHLTVYRIIRCLAPPRAEPPCCGAGCGPVWSDWSREACAASSRTGLAVCVDWFARITSALELRAIAAPRPSDQTHQVCREKSKHLRRVLSSSVGLQTRFRLPVSQHASSMARLGHSTRRKHTPCPWHHPVFPPPPWMELLEA